MKKTLLFITALLFCSFAFAQEGEIIYTDFEPDIIAAIDGINDDTIKLDIDNDGQIDIKFYLLFNMLAHVYDPIYHTFNNWTITGCWRDGDSTMLNADYLVWLPCITDAYYTEYFGMKKEIGDDVYYGWFYTYEINDWKNDDKQPWWTIYIDRMAYCTIPNYPLRAGQTSLADGIDEAEVIAVATLYPNPATGFVTITGKDLKQAKVFNSLGQQVASAKGEGERLTVDISNLPAGIYFVNITDGEGRKCVKKVVKE